MSSPYAILNIDGRQMRVEPGAILEIDRRTEEPGTSLVLDSVALAHDGETLSIGTPTVSGLKVNAEILEHIRGPKMVIFKMKPKKRYRRTTGHRQELTRVRVTSLEF